MWVHGSSCKEEKALIVVQTTIPRISAANPLNGRSVESYAFKSGVNNKSLPPARRKRL